jgi:hypothetical protein
MGACTFDWFEKTEDRSLKGRKAAFSKAVKDAQYECGHGGYTGTIAEKDEFTFVGLKPTIKEAREFADSLIEKGDKRIDDKWGPAGCIEVEQPSGFLFFGWASE